MEARARDVNVQVYSSRTGGRISTPLYSSNGESLSEMNSTGSVAASGAGTGSNSSSSSGSDTGSGSVGDTRVGKWAIWSKLDRAQISTSPVMEPESGFGAANGVGTRGCRFSFCGVCLTSGEGEDALRSVVWTEWTKSARRNNAERVHILYVLRRGMSRRERHRNNTRM